MAIPLIQKEKNMATVFNNRREVNNNRSHLDVVEMEYGPHWRLDSVDRFEIDYVSSQTNDLQKIIEYGKVGLWADQIVVDVSSVQKEEGGSRFPTLAEAREEIEWWAAFLREHGFTGTVVMDHCEHYFGERVEAYA